MSGYYNPRDSGNPDLPDYKVSATCGLVAMILNSISCILGLCVAFFLFDFVIDFISSLDPESVDPSEVEIVQAKDELISFFKVIKNVLIAVYSSLLVYFIGTYVVYAIYSNKEKRPTWLFGLLLAFNILFLPLSLIAAILNIVQCSKFISARNNGRSEVVDR